MPSDPVGRSLIVRRLGLLSYETAWQRMRDLTDGRGPQTPDELWLLEHPPVFTLGQAARPEHLLDPGEIPVVQSDRGGQVTYHGPGQIVAYLLLDLRRAGIGVKRLVGLLEQTVVELLAGLGIDGATRADAPGVYVAGAKIASVGLRVRHGCCYHGVALNLDADLAPFRRINPCGYPGLAVTRVRDLAPTADLDALPGQLAAGLARRLALRPVEPV